jgi:hypothetical protein
MALMLSPTMAGFSDALVVDLCAEVRRSHPPAR